MKSCKYCNLKIQFSFILLIISNLCNAQLSWKPITQENKPWARWWWQGNAVNEKDLTLNLEKYKKVGLGGLEITPIYGIKGREAEFIDFLSPRWVSMFKHTLSESKRLDLGIDLANASGWPFGGRWVKDEDACKYIAHKKYKIKAGESFNQKIEFIEEPLLRYVLPKSTKISELKQPISENENLQELAIDQVRFLKSLPILEVMAYYESGKVLRLTNQFKNDSILKLPVINEDYEIIAVFQGLHGKMVERAGPGGEGNVIDHFSEKAIKNYLMAFDSAFVNEDVSQMRAFFNDSYEVDDAKGQSDWTDNFTKEFIIRRGYDLRNHFPSLFSSVKNEQNSRILYDYRTTIGELILEKYTKQWANWAHSRNKIVRNQAHGSPANTLDLYAEVDIPEIEGTDLLRIKFASSAANVTGKKLASSESATWENEHFLSKLSDVKKALDLFMIGGINHIFYHGVNYSPVNEAFPGWLFYAATHFTPQNPFWKNFGTLNEYVARCQSFLQDSKANNDILLLFPITDRLNEPSKKGLLEHFDGVSPEFNGTDFKETAQHLLDKGFGFDYISDKQIKKLEVENQLIKTGGVQYKTILIAASEQMPLETFEHLLSLAKAGATIIFNHHLPIDVPGFGDLAERQAKFLKLKSTLIFKKNIDDFEIIKLERGQFLVGSNIDKMLEFANINREKMIDNDLQFIRKSTKNGILYFINNRSNKKFDGWVTLSSKVENLAIFNPMEASLGMAEFNAKTNQVYLQLDQGESCILESQLSNTKEKKYEYWSVVSDSMEISGNWKVDFIEGGPTLPASYETNKLESWTKQADNSKKDFSGTAQYSIVFKDPKASLSGYWLDLGAVSESAEVFLNGKMIATLIGPTFKVFLPKNLIKKSNLLVIKVTNLMANRVIALEKKGEIWQKFYNINISARLKPNLGKNGYFTTINWQPLDSGILIFRAISKDLRSILHVY